MNNLTEDKSKEEKIKAVEKILEEEKSKGYKKGVLVGAVAMALVFFITTLIGWYPPGGVSVDNKLKGIEHLVNKYYLFEDKVDEDAKNEATYKGYVDALGDPYSTYMTKDEFKEFSKGLEGEFYGVGIIFTMDITEEGPMPRVVNVVEGYTADKNGIKPNDLILKADGKSLKNMVSTQVAQMLKGEKGTKITLTIKRESTDKIFDVELTRQQIKATTVSTSVLDGDIGYITIREFDGNTAKEFKDAVDQMVAKNVKGLVIDLRNNSGGLMDATTEMLDYLLPKGKLLVTTRYKDGSKTTVKAEDVHQVDLPMAIIVNGLSASASEMFTGALQDYNKAVVVGTQSFGKGIVQNVYKLKDGSGLKITTAEYLTPKNRHIHKKGITPDIKVEDTRESVLDDNDAQLKAAMDAIEK